MGTIHSDKAWKAYGKKDPYFGVITDEAFRDENLSEENKKRFFKTGEAYVNRVYKVMKAQIDPAFNPEYGLDFGCGTGRIAIPLARHMSRVVGLDISEDMLSEAEKNAAEFKLTNVAFRLSDDDLSNANTETFDFVNTYIVLQHMNVERGMKVVNRLVENLKPGGYGVIHVVYQDARDAAGNWASKMRSRVPLVHNIFNRLGGKPWNTPLMQMNVYDLNAVHAVLQKAGVKKSFIEYENHGDIWSTTIFFKKLGSSTRI